MIEYFMPSEIARLVLGYLKDIGCMNSVNVYLEECTHLKEYVECLKNGIEYPTTIGGKNLLDILKDYCSVKAYVKEVMSKSECDEFKKSGDFLAYLESLALQSTAQSNQRNLFTVPQKRPTQWAVVAGQRQDENKDCCEDMNLVLVPTVKADSARNSPIHVTSLVHNATQTVRNEADMEVLKELQLSQNDSIIRRDTACSPVNFISPNKEISVTPHRMRRNIMLYSTPLKTCINDDANFRTPRRKSQLPRKRDGSTPQSARKRSCFNTPVKDDVEGECEENIDISALLDQLTNNSAFHEMVAVNINNAVKPVGNDEQEQPKVPAASVSSEEEVLFTENIIKDISKSTLENPAFEEMMNTLCGIKVDGNTLLDSNGQLLFDKFCNEITAMDEVEDINPNSDETGDPTRVQEQLIETKSPVSTSVARTPVSSYHITTAASSPASSVSSVQTSVKQVNDFSNGLTQLVATTSPKISSSHSTPRTHLVSTPMNVCQENEATCVVDDMASTGGLSKIPVVDLVTEEVGTNAATPTTIIDGNGMQHILVTAPSASTTPIQVVDGTSASSMILPKADPSLPNLFLISTPGENGVQSFQLVRMPISGVSLTPITTAIAATPTTTTSCQIPIENGNTHPTTRRTLRTLNAKRPFHQTPIVPKQKMIASRNLDFHQPSLTTTVNLPPSVFYPSSTTSLVQTTVENITTTTSPSLLHLSQQMTTSSGQQIARSIAKSPKLVSLMNSIENMVTEKQAKPGRHVRALEFGSPSKSVLCKTKLDGIISTSCSPEHETSIVKTVTNCKVSATVCEVVDFTSSSVNLVSRNSTGKAVVGGKKAPVVQSPLCKNNREKRRSTSKSTSSPKRKKSMVPTDKQGRKPKNVLGRMDVDQFLSTLHYVE